MKKFLVALLLICACLGLADNAKSVRKILDANYKAVSAAMEHNHIDTVAAMLTDDFIVVSPEGQKVNKSQIITQFRALAGNLHDAKWVRKIKSLTLQGNLAIVIVDGNFRGTLTGQDGQPHVLGQTATSKDTWIKVNNKYLLKKSEVQKNSMTMDGQAMPTPGH